MLNDRRPVVEDLFVSGILLLALISDPATQHSKSGYWLLTFFGVWRLHLRMYSRPRANHCASPQLTGRRSIEDRLVFLAPSTCVTMGIWALIGPNWLLYRYAVGVEAIALGGLILAFTSVHLRGSWNGLTTFTYPIAGVCHIVTGLAVLSLAIPLPPPIPELSYQTVRRIDVSLTWNRHVGCARNRSLRAIPHLEVSFGAATLRLGCRLSRQAPTAVPLARAPSCRCRCLESMARVG